jgi:ankyrin repeat protein
MVALLLDAGVTIDAQDRHGVSALMTAVDSGRLDLVELLVARGANRNLRDFQGKTALMRALAKHRLDIVSYLQNAR